MAHAEHGEGGRSGRILVTGARGVVGRVVVARLGPRAVPLSRQQLDICDPDQIERVLARWQPVAVINAAAWADVERCERDPDGAWQVNAWGPEQLARACARHRVALVHVSTDYVFGATNREIYHRDSPTEPVNVYGKTKAEGELRVLDAWPRAAVARTAWVYGLEGRGFGLLAARRLRDRQVLFAIQDRFGHPTWVEDLADRLVALAERSVGGVHHAVNAGPTSWYRFALRLAQGLGTGDARLAGISFRALPSRVAPRPRRVRLETTEVPGSGLPPLRSWEQAQDAFLSALARATTTRD